MRAVRIVSVVAVACATLAGCSSGTHPSQTLYGPPGARFEVAFPSKPQTVPDPANTQGLSGEIRSYAYAVSSEPDLFSNTAPVPGPPTFAVIVVTLRSASDARSFLHDAARAPGMGPVTMDGMPGYEFVGSANSALNHGTKITDPKASEGTLFLARGATLFALLVVTVHAAQARAFLGSFRTT